MLRIGQSRRGLRRVEALAMEAAKTFGGQLFRAVMTGDIQGCLQRSLTKSAQQKAGLRIRLRLSDAPELVDLPWEFLYDATLNRFLSLSIETPVVRYLDLPGWIDPLAVTPPLRVLVMIASPADSATLDTEQEWRHLKAAVQDLEARGLLVLERLPHATLVALQKRLRQQDYHVLHFIGHGGFDSQAGDGILLLEDENDQSRIVSGQSLGMLLHDQETLRLAILNACEGGRTSRTDPFAGVAQSLLQQGVPAVLAMQFAITDQAAITLAHEFYSALADGYPVDAALTEARKSLFAAGNAVEWATPVLYLRAPDGQIFDVANRSTAPPAVAVERRPSVPPTREWRQLGAMMAGLVLLAVLVVIWFYLPFGLSSNSEPTEEPSSRAGGLVTGVQNTPSALAATLNPTHTTTLLPTATQSPLASAIVTLLPTHASTLIGDIYSFDDGAGDGWYLDTEWKVVPLDGGGGALQVTAPQASWPTNSLQGKQPLKSDIALQVRVRLLQPTNRTAGDADLKLSIRANNNNPAGFESYSVYMSRQLQNILLRRDALTGYAAGRTNVGHAPRWKPRKIHHRPLPRYYLYTYGLLHEFSSHRQRCTLR